MADSGTALERTCRWCFWWSRRRTAMVCSRASSENGDADFDDSLAVAQDGESYQAWLVTHAEFGCVQFQPKLGGETR